ncbi:tryptophan synthase subunit alpha [Streptomyces sp. NPDC092296]|uniref:tryptophan synthase subunit alpha n=1 Tax=Streptomyces sp. NPDC092296 TaxID=3366012 RepID=UPI00381B8B3B
MTLAPARPVAATELDRAFRTARAEGRALLAAYLPAGYPTLDTSLDALYALGRHADILEIGIPFSDPVMDGPTIQAAGVQALRAGFRTGHLFGIVRELAASSPAQLVAMTYWQPVDRYGPQRFAADLADAGAAGVILPDLPVDEAGPWLEAARDHGLHTILVAAPNASDARLAQVCAASSGMVYAPAVGGVTGHCGPLNPRLPAFINRLREAAPLLPIGVGIGVSTADHAAQLSRIADAAIVGSELIRRLRDAPGAAGIAAAAELAAELAAGVRRRMHPAA